MSKEYHYETSCVSANAEDINEMTEAAVQVSYGTLLKHCEGIKEWERNMGYRRPGLSLKNDWLVSFWKSKYQGRDCYYICHSAIEHIWVKA
jgi:hypothetical protein